MLTSVKIKISKKKRDYLNKIKKKQKTWENLPKNFDKMQKSPKKFKKR